MITAVIMLCQEWEHGPDGKEHKVCPMLKLDKSKFTKFSYVTQELFNPDKMLQIVDGKFMFNNKDISKEGQWIAESWVKQDFNKMGQILGSTLLRHSKGQLAALKKMDDLFMKQMFHKVEDATYNENTWHKDLIDATGNPDE